MGEITIVSTPYDDVFRTLLNDCRELVIPVINELFWTKYSGNEKIVFSQDVHFLNRQDGNEDKEITDTSFTILGDETKKYHLECQSNTDSSMLVRFFEYDTQIALDTGKIDGDVLTVTFPHSALLYLRHTSATSDKLKIRMVTPGGSVEYDILVMKSQEYTIDEIFEKKLLFLIPFYIFVHEKYFQEYENDAVKLSTMLAEYEEIKNRLEAMANREEICEYTKCTINDMTNKTAWHLAKNYETVRKGVKDIMGGKVLEYEAKTILNRGRAEGREEGRLAGRAEGREEGRLEGKEVGRLEGKILTVRIFQAAKKNPEFTCNQIAEEVGCSAQEVDDTLKMFGL